MYLFYAVLSVFPIPVAENQIFIHSVNPAKHENKHLHHLRWLIRIHKHVFLSFFQLLWQASHNL